MHWPKIRWSVIWIFLLEALIFTEAFGGPQEECIDAGGVYQESGLCTCKNITFNPSDFLCTESGLVKRNPPPSSSVAAPSDSRIWRQEIGQERNKRPFEPAKIEGAVKYSDMMSRVSYDNGDDVYKIGYDPYSKMIIMLETFRGSSGIAPFQMQYTLLRVFAKKINSQIVINSILRSKVFNQLSRNALKIDFPSEDSLARIDNFQEMEFLKSPNGSNTLDLIKKMRPDRDPFSLISEVAKLPKTDPNLLDGINNDFWADNGESDISHYVYKGDEGVIEIEEPSFKAYPICVLDEIIH